jgi:hypothetical protein
MTDDLLDELDAAGRSVATTVYQFMVCHQAVLKHPGAALLDDEHWRTLCHNAAFLAGCAADGADLTVLSGDDVVLATTETGVVQ